MQINEKSVWQLCLEIAVDMEVLSSLPTTTRAKAEKIKAHLDAYLEAATPPDVAGIDEALDRFERAAFAATANLPRGRDARERESKSRSIEYNAARDAIATALRLSASGGVPKGWISVSDRLPGEQGKDSENVLCFLNGHCDLHDMECRKGGGWGIRIGFYDAEKQCFRAGGIAREVTHWHPLPASPTVEAGHVE